jgi:hypothetical protein
MNLALAVLVLLTQTPPPPPPPLTPALEPVPYPVRAEPEAEPQHIGNTFSLYVSIVEPSFAVFGGTAPGTTSSAASAAIRIGAVFAGRHALLFGLGGTIFGVPGGSVLVGVFAPQYRIHFKPLVVGSLAPFLQIEVVIGFLLGGGVGTSTAVGVLGFGPGFGGEMLFTRNFGVVAALGGRLIYVGSSGGLAAAVLWGSVAVALHF